MHKTTQDKAFFLALLHANTKCYRLLLCVYTIITDGMSLKQTIHYNECADMIEGFEDFSKGQRTPYVANYASAFMVRGLSRKWKQLFGYCFTSGPMTHIQLQLLLLEAISVLRKAGTECLVFICDQGAGNRSDPLCRTHGMPNTFL